MDIKVALSIENSFENANRIALNVLENRKLIENIFNIFWGENIILTQRASWPLLICAEKEPSAIMPFVEKMILTLQKKGITDAIKRNTVRILADFQIPEHLEGILTEICFKYLNTASEAIAIKVFSMIILERMIEKHPELKAELIYSIEIGMEFGSTGYKNRGGKILKSLKAIH